MRAAGRCNGLRGQPILVWGQIAADARPGQIAAKRNKVSTAILTIRALIGKPRLRSMESKPSTTPPNAQRAKSRLHYS